MTLSRLLLAALAAIAVPTAAHADTIDDFTVTGNGQTITFSVPASGIVMDHPHGVIWTETLSDAMVNGASVTGSIQIYLPGFPTLPSVLLNLPTGELAFYGPWIVGPPNVIPISNPTPMYPDNLAVAIAPGTYSEQQEAFPSTDNPYTFQITQESVAPTPEPSAFVLLGSGLACLMSLALRRRASALRLRVAD